VKIFVTGATGAVGSRAVARLLAEGHDVTALVRSDHQPARVERNGAGRHDRRDGEHRAVLRRGRHRRPAAVRAAVRAGPQQRRGAAAGAGRQGRRGGQAVRLAVPLHPDDAARAVAAAPACDSGVFNVCESPVVRSDWAAAIGRAASARSGAPAAPAAFYPTFLQRLGGARAEPLPPRQEREIREATGWRPHFDSLAAAGPTAPRRSIRSRSRTPRRHPTPQRNQEHPVDGAPSTTEFERHRDHLTGVAYRMLGTLADAEDAVQETYLRYIRGADAGIRDVRAWLTTTITRLCLDQLGSARARRESYVGPWLPEPVVGTGRGLGPAPLGLGPEDRVTLDESVSVAMLVLLESLSPAERTALILRDVLGLPYGEVSQVLGRTQTACRQLVTRARTRIRERAPRFTPDRGQHADAVQAFLAACSHGSVKELVRVLDPDIVLRSDGGGLVPGVARRPVNGAENVARLLLGVAAKHAATPRAVTVNGSPGLVFHDEDGVVGVMAFTVADGLITEINFLVNPEKLHRVDRRP
jgi:RNA polymerase sigma-70 factor (ECF subfamily)